MAGKITKHAVTMADVARQAGVSSTTVSLVINNAPTANIPDDTRNRVLVAAAALGYRPNAAARGIRTKRTHTIGVITDTIATEPYAGKIVRGMQDAAWDNNKTMLLFNTDNDPVKADAAVELLLAHRVEGIVYAAEHHQEVQPPKNLWEVQAVLCDCYVADRSLPSVVPDEREGGRTATDVLLRAGHRRIGFINVDEPSRPAQEGRLAGYKDALAAFNVPFDPSLVLIGNTAADDGYLRGRELMQLDTPPTAIFAGTDRMAMGVYDALRDLGLRVPDDIAVVGFDNQEIISQYLRPPLTSVELPHYGMGYWAVTHLLTLLQRDSSLDPPPPLQHIISCPLIERRSV
jgi:LacI family transcriptional regulator